MDNVIGRHGFETTDAFVDYLRDELIPACHELGLHSTAEDFGTCHDLIVAAQLTSQL